MRLRILSDLHLEFSEWTPPKTDCDVVVLAGDIHVGANALPWIEKHFQGQTVIYVMGNHEGYKYDITQVALELNTYANAPAPIVDLRFLNNEWTPVTKSHGGNHTETVWFFGGTLWTDFEIDKNPRQAKMIAKQCMNDYRLIKRGGFQLQPDDTVEMHTEFLQQLGAGHPGTEGDKYVVVGHHLPHRNSIDADYRSSEVNPAYASDLSEYMQDDPDYQAPALWVHGHTHRSKDYVVGGTRVVANPRGYSADPRGQENPGFRGDFVVEV